jgi:hypothetical protein
MNCEICQCDPCDCADMMGYNDELWGMAEKGNHSHRKHDGMGFQENQTRSKCSHQVETRSQSQHRELSKGLRFSFENKKRASYQGNHISIKNNGDRDQ